MAAENMKQWTIRGKSGIESLVLEKVPIPEPDEHDVLIKMHAVALNYRDIMIATGTYYWGQTDGVVPLSDGAGEVISVGVKVRRFKLGQRVVPIFFQSFIGGTLTPDDMGSALGAMVDGVFREYAIFNEEGLVHMPASLSYEEAATLPCAAVTAWSCLYGPRSLRPGDTVLTQGTGGVSLFALQFAVAGGAEVIATTSSKQKAARLKQLGAHHVINYREDPNWGETARKLSLRQESANYVVEIGGPGTLQQSSIAAAIGGEVEIVGRRSVEEGSKEVAAWNPHAATHGTRRITVGSRVQFEEMNRAIEVNKIRPVIDERIFSFDEAKEAFRYLWDQKHFGKVVIRIN